jgi:hypothetical protein
VHNIQLTIQYNQQKSNAENYRAELERQMEEKRQRELEEKRKREQEDVRYEREVVQLKQQQQQSEQEEATRRKRFVAQSPPRNYNEKSASLTNTGITDSGLRNAMKIGDTDEIAKKQEAYERNRKFQEEARLQAEEAIRRKKEEAEKKKQEEEEYERKYQLGLKQLQEKEQKEKEERKKKEKAEKKRNEANQRAIEESKRQAEEEKRNKIAQRRGAVETKTEEAKPVDKDDLFGKPAEPPTQSFDEIPVASKRRRNRVIEPTEPEPVPTPVVKEKQPTPRREPPPEKVPSPEELRQPSRKKSSRKKYYSSEEEPTRRSRGSRRRRDYSDSDSDDRLRRSSRSRKRDETPPRSKSREKDNADALTNAVRKVIAEAKSEFQMMKQEILQVKQQNEKKLRTSVARISNQEKTTPRLPVGVSAEEWAQMLKSLDSDSHFIYPRESMAVDKLPQTVQIIINTDRGEKKTSRKQTPVVEPVEEEIPEQAAEPIPKKEEKPVLTEPVKVKSKKKRTVTTHEVAPFVAEAEQPKKRKRKKRIRDTPEPGQVIAVQTDDVAHETAEASIETNQQPVAVGGTQTLTPPRTPELRKEREQEVNSDEDMEMMLRQNRSKLELLSQITETADLGPDGHIAMLHEYLNKSHAEIKPPSRPTTTSSIGMDEDADGAINFDQPSTAVRKRRPRRPSSTVVEQSLPNSSKFLQVLAASDED